MRPAELAICRQDALWRDGYCDRARIRLAERRLHGVADRIRGGG